MIGLAAGVDKNALSLPFWESMGFDFVVVGTVTAMPQKGNPNGMISPFYNNLGLPNDGIEVVLKRIRDFKRNSTMLITLSVDPYLIYTLDNYDLEGVDIIEWNLSCPNIPEVKLSDIEVPEFDRTVYVKLGPEDDIDIIIDHDTISGAVLSNTRYGHSGSLLKGYNIKNTKSLSKFTSVIGCGGILSIKDIIDYYEAGVDSVQLCSALPVLGIENVKNLIQEHYVYVRERANR